MLEALLSAIASNSYMFTPPEVVPNKPFKGFVPAEELITGSSLAGMISLASGRVINDDAGWLHYLDNNKEFYIARLTLRCNMTGAEYTASGASAGKLVNINGQDYRVRLMTGMASNPYPSLISTATGGEWDKYIYPIYGGGDRPAVEQWSYYTLHDLGLNANMITDGSITVCKDLHTTLANAYACRGWDYYGDTASQSAITRKTVINDANAVEGNSNYGKAAYGWRPLLEKINGGIAVFQGEVQAADLITPVDLKTALGITAGNAMNPTTTWLKFIRAGKTLYTPKTPIHNNLSHGYLDRLNVVNGSRTIVIGASTYKVRLMTCLEAGTDTLDLDGEWYQFIVNLSNGVSASYTPAQLGTGTGGSANGELAIVQEKLSTGNWASPGYTGISGLLYQQASYDSGDISQPGYGYRPVLELVG